MPFYPGKVSTVAVDTISIPFDQCQFANNGDVIDVTNFTSSGAYEHVDGLKKIDFTASGPYKGAAGFTKGDTVEIVVTLVAGTAFTFSAVVSEVSISTSVKGVAMINMSAVSTGAFTVTF